MVVGRSSVSCLVEPGELAASVCVFTWMVDLPNGIKSGKYVGVGFSITQRPW